MSSENSTTRANRNAKILLSATLANTSQVLFRLCANTDPQRDSLFTKGPTYVLDHTTREIGIGTKLGLDTTRKLPGEGFKRPWPPLIQLDAAVKARVTKFLMP